MCLVWGDTPDAGTPAHPGCPAEDQGGESPAVGANAGRGGFTPGRRPKIKPILTVEMPPRNHFAAAHAAITLDRKIKVHLDRIEFLTSRMNDLGTGPVDRDVTMLILKDIKKLWKKVDTMRAKSNSLVPPAEESDEEEAGDAQ